MTLQIEIWLRALDGRPPTIDEFPRALACDADGPFLRVTDADGAQYWYTAAAVTKASATPTEGSK